MRFERDLHRWRVPAWTESYIDYSSLKGLINAKTSRDDLDEAIKSEIDIFKQFLSAQDARIQAQVSALEEQWGLEVASIGAGDLAKVVKRELEDLETSLLEYARDVAECHLLLKVNCDALVGIVDKRGDISDVKPRETIPIPSSIAQSSSQGTWLRKLNSALKLVREARDSDDGGPRFRSLLLERGADRVPPEIIKYLCADDALRMADALTRKDQEVLPQGDPTIAQLIEVASIYQATACVKTLLPMLQSKPQDDNHHSFLHEIVRQIPRSQSLEGETGTEYFHQVLKHLPRSQSKLLQTRDSLGRLPLHYAARLGLAGVCRELIAAMRCPSRTKASDSYNIGPDAFGQTPLEEAVRYGHLDVVEVLLSEHMPQTLLNEVDIPEESQILATAISSERIDIASRLIEGGWGYRYVSRSGKTVLHLAAEHGLSDLINGLAALVPINAQDKARGRTPLTIACVQGHLGVVEALLELGADPSIQDQQGWLAKDHAAYRGHIKILEAINSPGSAVLYPKTGKRGKTSIVPTDTKDAVIFVHLGTLDLFKPAPAVDVAPYLKLISPRQMPVSCLSLSVSLVGDKKRQKYTFSLPLMTDNSDWPIFFTTDNPEAAVISFKLKSSLAKKPIGTGVALLSGVKGGFGVNRESLIRDFSIPLISDQHGHVGTVVFTFVVAKQFSGPEVSPSQVQTLELEAATTLCGHRGNGQNGDSRCLQLGENTIQSFQSAVKHGADYIECDVQLTKDDVSVIYHDFLVAETGSDVAMHTLTYDQFMAICDAQSAPKPPHATTRKMPWDEETRPRFLPCNRRRSLGAPMDSATEALISQMQRTYKYPGFKPNLRTHSIRDHFITLDELFKGMPESVPLDIELKYPMLSEAADYQLDPFAPEINHFLDKILSVTYACAGPRRRVIFSSFSPEICMVMTVKQKTYPILFLNDTSSSPTGDMRATSLQTAIRFAHRFGMNGVGILADPFVASPGLVHLARKQGLYTASYGALNDEADCARVQAEAGIDMLVVNRIRFIQQAIGKQ